MAILVPYGGSDQHRAAALRYVTDRLAAEVPWQVTIGTVGGRPWVKADAVGAALRETDAEVLILHDADVYSPGLAVAVDTVLSGRSAWALPHTTVKRLTERATAAVLAGGPLGGSIERAYRGVVAGGLVILRRELYEEAPLDPRFEGWGHEDLAAGLAWRKLAGSAWRGTAPLWHLWHPPQPKLSPGVGSRKSKLLLERYRACKTEDMLRELITEGRGAPDGLRL